MNFRKHPGAEPDDDSTIPVPMVRGMRMPKKGVEAEHSEESLPKPPPVPRRSRFPSMHGSSGWAGPIVAIIVAVGGAFGGSKGISEILGTSKATQAQIESLRKEIAERTKIEQAERAKIQSAAVITDERVAYQAGLLCELNEGKPHTTFPCDGFATATKPLGQETPRFKSDNNYPNPKKATE